MIHDTYWHKVARADTATKALEDGNGNNIAETYAKSEELREAMESQSYSAYPINSDSELLEHTENYSSSKKDNTKYSFAINMRYDNPSYLAGGIWEVEGFRTNTNFEYQLFKKYLKDDVKICTRSKYNGTWGEFSSIISEKDLKNMLANYLPLTGGTLRGTAPILGLDCDTAAGWLIADDVYLGFYNAKTEGWVFTSKTDGSNVFYGKASECLPLSGGTLTTTLSAVPLVLVRTDTDVVRLMFGGSSGALGYLGFNTVNSPVFVDKDQTAEYKLHHQGNKPTGTYTGNGTSRTISIGGLGNALLIHAADKWAIATPEGLFEGYYRNSSTVVRAMEKTAAKFADGVLTIASTSVVINDSGTEYSYQVL